MRNYSQKTHLGLFLVLFPAAPVRIRQWEGQRGRGGVQGVPVTHCLVLWKLHFPSWHSQTPAHDPSGKPCWDQHLDQAGKISFTTPVFHVGALRQELRGLAKEKFQIHSEVQAGLSWRCQEGISQPRDGAGNEEEFLAGTTSPVPGTAGASRRQWCLGKAP